MNINELAVLVCVACGVESGLLKLGGSMWPNARCCAGCLAQWGVARLVLLADQTLARATPNRRVLGGTKCLHCGEPVVLGADGLPSAWCESCNRERLALVERTLT